ncbi:MAG: hypothetical protein CM15mP102_04410 [Flavobacteriales bacterium]|nr:MAG: hypothetical protein CM15mP102_04410 [Flavobacteriales bacterium]
MFKHLSVSVGGQYTETWTGKQLDTIILMKVLVL